MIKTFVYLTIILFSLAGALRAQDAEPTLVSAPPFNISAEDEAAGIDGTIKVAAEINAAGDVVRSIVYVGPAWPCGADLDGRVSRVVHDAENAVLKFKFKPATKDGKPVESRAGISIIVGQAAKKKVEQTDPNAPKVPKQITGGVLNGKAVSLMKPRFPPEARAAGASGAVSVQVLLNEEGKVVTAQAVNGSPFFHTVARDAACASSRPHASEAIL